MSHDDQQGGTNTNLDHNSLISVIEAISGIAASLRKLEHFQNYAGKTNKEYRRNSIQQNWNDARQAVTTLSSVLQGGRRLIFPLLVYEIDASGQKIARVNTAIVRDILTDIWQDVDWIDQGGSLSDNAEIMYGLPAFCQKLERSAARLRAILRSADIAPS